MEERIAVSKITGRRFKAVPNVKQILERRMSCDGCAFFNDYKKTNCNPRDVEHDYGDEGALSCGDWRKPLDQQIIWMEIDENGNYINNGREVEIPQER